MRHASCHVLAGLALLLTFPPCPGAESVPPAQVAPPVAEVSLDQFIANAKRSAATGSTELKEIVAQLDPLREKRKTLLASRRAKETELARLQAAKGDAKRIAALRGEVDASRRQLNIVDTQFQVLIFRVQSLQNPGNAANALKVPGSMPPTVASPTPARFTRTVPPDKVKAAADSLADSPAPTAAAARTAATQILAVSQPGYTASDVDHLAQLVLQLAVQDNSAAVRSALEAAQPADGKKPAPSDSNQIKLVLPTDPKPAAAGDRKHLQELQLRQARLERALIELSRSAPLPASPPAAAPVPDRPAQAGK